MPCSDQPMNDAAEATHNLLRQRDAMLCSVLSALERAGNLQTVIASIDAAEAGINKAAMLAWWRDHKAADERRRLSEEAQRAERLAQDERRRIALQKLTPAERRELGLKEG